MVIARQAVAVEDVRIVERVMYAVGNLKNTRYLREQAAESQIQSRRTQYGRGDKELREKRGEGDRDLSKVKEMVGNQDRLKSVSTGQGSIYQKWSFGNMVEPQT